MNFAAFVASCRMLSLKRFTAEKQNAVRLSVRARAISDRLFSEPSVRDNPSVWLSLLCIGIEGAWRCGLTPEQIEERLCAILDENFRTQLAEQEEKGS